MSSTQWYLDGVGRELADLPEDERAELLEDLAAHFVEFELDDDLVATLGDPVTYARELRDAAGLSAGHLADTHVALIDRARANIGALRRSRWWRAIAEFLSELRPAWWVVRAWLIVAALAGEVDFPIPRIADNTLIGVAALILLVPVSIALGLQARNGQRKGLNVALTVFGALFFVVLPVSANNDPGGNDSLTVVVASTSPSPRTVGGASTTRLGSPIAGQGQPTTNGLWAFDGAGNAYLVTRVNQTSTGRVEFQALCPDDSRGELTVRSADGTPIVCVGSLDPDTARPVGATVPTTTVSTSTLVPTTTTLSTTTLAPSTTG